MPPCNVDQALRGVVLVDAADLILKEGEEGGGDDIAF